MNQPKFDTDSQALSNRIRAHDKFSKKDINEWIFALLKPENGNFILDIGCGTGKQSLPLAKHVGEMGRIISADLSQESLQTLAMEAERQGSKSVIKSLCCNIDELDNHLEPNSLNRVLSSFSVYYTKNSDKLFQTISKALTQDGVFFFCGPGHKNNFELKKFHHEVKGEGFQPETSSSIFMEETGPSLGKNQFSQVEIFNFENSVIFENAEELVKYWSSYAMFDPEIEKSFYLKAKKHFEGNSTFETVKRVIGVRCTK
jgi:ubiquinone/menaquinone biosynthesis C-methylase UbiE